MSVKTEDFTSDEVVNGDFKTEGANGETEKPAAAAPTVTSVTKGALEDRKLFVGGLSWETTEPEIAEYFGQFGELESVNLKMDMMTGRSRCFAFLVFKNSDDVDKILSTKEHVISSKKIDVKKAKAKPGKIFVGGLPPELEEDAIRDYFTKNFGTVAEIEAPFDKERQMRKNFCFVTFEREEVLQDVLRISRQKIGDYEVDVKKATPRPKMPMGGGGMMGGPWGGYNGYYGGYGGGYGGYYDYSGYYGGGGWGGGGGGAQAGASAGDSAGGAEASGGEAAAGGGKMSRESGEARVTPY